MAQKQFGKDQSRYVMVIYMKDNKLLRYYSLPAEDRKGQIVSLSGMKRRLLDNRYKGRYHTAIVYEMSTQRELAKYVSGSRVS